MDASPVSNFSGILMRKVVPSDNSCLFASIGFCLSGNPSSKEAYYMRELVSAIITSNPQEYTKAMLGRATDEYTKWILKEESWGGAIELSILANYYGMEIDVVNTQYGNVSRFGEDQNYSQRILLIYDGIHYDPLYMELFEGERTQTIFPIGELSVLKQAEELASEARAAHQFTDTVRFTLKCLTCQVHLVGEVGAQKHAKETGHTNFGEIEPS